MPKQMKYRDEALRAIKAGVDKLADAVRVTMGPKGRYVVLSNKFGPPTITNDGVTIAKQIELEDPFEDMAAQLVREVASKTNDTAGDGTTTATVLTQAIVNEGLRVIAAGANATHIKRGIDKAVEFVVEAIAHMATPVKDHEIEQIATISATDASLGQLIAQGFEKVGRDGVLTVEEGRSTDTSIEIVRGMQFDRGFLSPHFTDSGKAEAILDDVAVVITDRRVMLADLLAFFEKFLQSGNKPLLLIAEEIEADALALLVVNKIQGRLKIIAVKAPGFGGYQKDVLQDIAVLTGAQVVASELGTTLSAAELVVLGHAKRVIATKDSTTIIDGSGDKQAIERRVLQIREQLNSASELDGPRLQQRLAKLVGGVAIIKAGGSTETEMKARKYKIEDAINATRAGVHEGIVPGGGTALLRAAYGLIGLKGADADEQIGITIVRKALEQPVRQIAENAGIEGSVVIQNICASADPHYGLNADTMEYGNLIEQGVIDPAKVTRSALQNAASIAGLLLTTDVLVVDIKERK